jgi:hypothetical protein
MFVAVESFAGVQFSCRNTLINNRGAYKHPVVMYCALIRIIAASALFGTTRSFQLAKPWARPTSAQGYSSMVPSDTLTMSDAETVRPTAQPLRLVGLKQFNNALADAACVGNVICVRFMAHW